MSRLSTSSFVNYVCPFIIIMGLVAPAALAEPSLDIRPSICPNLANVKARGLLPVAIVSDTDFSATRVDWASVELSRSDGVGGVATPALGRRGGTGRPIDVATPSRSDVCSTAGADGLHDLLVMFLQSDVVNQLALDGLPVGTSVEVCATGRTRVFDGEGESFEACDHLSVAAFGNLQSPPLDGIGTLPRFQR